MFGGFPGGGPRTNVKLPSGRCFYLVQELVDGELNYKLLRRRRSEA